MQRSHPRVPYLQVHAVPEGVAMMVTELKCKQDNCPPFETIMVVMYGAAGGRAYFSPPPFFLVEADEVKDARKTTFYAQL